VEAATAAANAALITRLVIHWFDWQRADPPTGSMFRSSRHTSRQAESAISDAAACGFVSFRATA